MKLMLVCTSGGHFSTMRRLESFWSNHERVWVTDWKKDTKLLEQEEKVHWLPYQAPRNIWALCANIPQVFNSFMVDVGLETLFCLFGSRYCYL